MTYFQVENFRLGMDRRRVNRAAAEAGSCWLLKNAHITRGGDIERHKKFVSTFTIPSGTKGMLAIKSTIYVFGAGSNPGVPAGLTYQRLLHPADASATIASILDARASDGKPYVIAEFDDGNVFHYYDGARVTEWDDLAETIGTNNAVASALAARVNNDNAVTAVAVDNVVTITGDDVNTAFTLTRTVTNKGLPAATAVAATATVQITGGTNDTGVNTVSSITVNDVEILDTAVDWATSDNETATAVATQINTFNSTPEYTAVAAGGVVTITAADAGADANTLAIDVTVTGDVTVDAEAAMTGGVDTITDPVITLATTQAASSSEVQISTATVTGTFQTANVYTLTVNGTAYTVTGNSSGTGRTILPFRSKMYSTAGSNLYFSALNSPPQWVTGVDPGFINFSSQNEGQEDLTAAAEYQGLMAIFSQNNIIIESIVEDSDLNVFVQSVSAVGTRSPRSVKSYGTDDVFYLSDTGVRSLRARDSSNTASVNDVGTAMDTFIQDHIATLTDTQIAEAVAEIEPIDGRYMLALGDYVFVFSYFPSAKISAWSFYDMGMQVTDWAKVGNRLYARSGNVVYLYGGSDNATYPGTSESEVEIGLPYIAAKSPATGKDLIGWDILCTNEWAVKVLPSPTDDTIELNAGVAAETTYAKGGFEVPGETPMFAVKLTCARAGAATVSALAIHYLGDQPAG